VGPSGPGTTPPNPDGLYPGQWQMTGVPGTCNGDSGGPAFWPAGAVDEALVGVTSTGDATCQQWGADTDPGFYLCWLASVGVLAAACPASDGGFDGGADAASADAASDGGDGDAGDLDAGEGSDAAIPDASPSLSPPSPRHGCHCGAG